MPEWIKILATVLAAICLSVFIALVIVGFVESANSDRIDACHRLSGEVVYRGFNCELPSGIIVDPIKWEKSQ